MSSTPNTPTQNGIDFRDRNAVERFLETKRFRRCTNLRCDPVSHPNMQMLYMPVCLEGRFAREGFAQHIDLPLPTRPLSPITYTTIPQWAPLISCPRHCKGYHNRTVAKVRALFKKQSHKEDSPKKEPWSRGEKIAAWTLGIAVVAFGATFFVPEVRQFFHLEKRPQPAPAVATPSPMITTPSQSTPAPKSPEPSKPNKTRKPTQQTTTRVAGNDNVAGNNISGDHNVTGNNNQTGPTANAPNGIAISGGNVTNPTVNNITALPDLTMSDEQEKQVTDSLGQTFAGVDVSIIEAQPNQNTRDFSERLARILKASGANVQLSSAFMYVPPAGMTLHKGMAITSFPPERKSIVDKFVNALGTARVIQVVPIYEREDKKINIVVNRSRDTPEEGKQF